jgi:hypothetical protein
MREPGRGEKHGRGRSGPGQRRVTAGSRACSPRHYPAGTGCFRPVGAGRGTRASHHIFGCGLVRLRLSGCDGCGRRLRRAAIEAGVLGNKLRRNGRLDLAALTTLLLRAAWCHTLYITLDPAPARPEMAAAANPSRSVDVLRQPELPERAARGQSRAAADQLSPRGARALGRAARGQGSAARGPFDARRLLMASRAH